MNNSSLRSVPAEAWAAITALLTGAAVIAKKLLPHRLPPKPEYVTRAEFHQEMTSLRDRIADSHLAMTDKLDAHHKELLAALDNQVTRINDLASGLARVDERTKLHVGDNVRSP
jgi:hypothetical protein